MTSHSRTLLITGVVGYFLIFIMNGQIRTSYPAADTGEPGRGARFEIAVPANNYRRRTC